MEILLSVLVALALGGVWVLLVRRTARRRRTLSGPRPVTRALDDYRRGRWAEVVAAAPGLLSAPPEGDDRQWRPALELALGHALVEQDRPAEAVPHLERGLLLQSALRRTQGGSEAPTPGEAKLRHVLGWALAASGHPAQARREYRRVLDTPDIDADIRARVTASLQALDA